jgi:tetratricopeptide (TPR) repeat protein
MTTPPDLAVRALCAAADEALTEASFRTGDFAEAERMFTEARDLAIQEGDRAGEARAFTGLGMTRHGRTVERLAAGGQPFDSAALPGADVDAEEELMRSALAIWQETGDAAGTGQALFGMSLVFQVLHQDWDGAMPYLWQAFGLAEAVQESGDLYGASEIHRHLGFYYLYKDIRPAEAVRRLGQSLALRERLADLRRVPSALVALGRAELAAGDPRHAAEHLYRAAELARAGDLLPWRIQDAEQAVGEAEEALRALGQGQDTR